MGGSEYPIRVRDWLAMRISARYRARVRLQILAFALLPVLGVTLVPVGAAGLQAPAGGAEALVCEGPRVSQLFIDNQSIYNPSDIEEMGRFGWTLRLINRLHIRTRADFIRRELLFGVGDCVDDFRLRESARLLRLYPFISTADVYSVEQPDRSHHAIVETRDEWTTKLDLGVSFDGGIKIETIELTEENFLGRGVELEAFLEERRERRDYGFRFRTNRVWGSRADGRFEIGRTRVGDFFAASLSYPFVGEGGRYAAFQTFDHKEDLFSYSLPSGSVYTNAVLPVSVEGFALAVAARSGEPGDLTMLGLGISRESVRFAGYPGSLGLIREGDFATQLPAGDSILARVGPQIQEQWKTRVNMMLGWRNLRFLELRGLDALHGIQDIQVGSEVNVTFGANPGTLGSGGIDQSNDIYTRLTAFGGLHRGGLLLNSRVLVDGRNVLSGGAHGAGWQDILADADVYAYWLPATRTRHTFFARVSASGGWDVRFPFQLTLGGREGLRGFREDRFPGGRRILMTFEDRVRVEWPVPDLIDFGLTVFGDLGRMWAGDVPFGRDTGWLGNVGGGLRFGFPSGSRGVVRLDLAFPLTGGTPVFRVSLKEFIGLRRGFDDQQVLRSRVLGIGGEVFNPERRPGG